MALSRTLRLVVALALLAAWQSALVHPLRHVDANGEYVHLAGGAKNQGDKSNGSKPLCEAIAAVAVCIGASAEAASFVPRGVASIVATLSISLRGAPALAYRSQAPPALL